MSDKLTPMGEFFDSVAHQYDTVQVSNIDRGEEYYRELAGPLPTSEAPYSMLDLGAGTGLDLVSIFERLPNLCVDCIDVSRELLRKLEARFPEKTKQLSLHHCDYFDVDFGDLEFGADFGAKGYDLMLASATLHHFTAEEKRVLFERLAVVLKPDGIFVIGDFYVDEKVAGLFREHYDQIEASGVDVSYGKYHLDLPTTIERDTDSLQQSGFGNVDVYWKSASYAILSVRL